MSALEGCLDYHVGVAKAPEFAGGDVAACCVMGHQRQLGSRYSAHVLHTHVYGYPGGAVGGGEPRQPSFELGRVICNPVHTLDKPLIDVSLPHKKKLHLRIELPHLGVELLLLFFPVELKPLSPR